MIKSSKLDTTLLAQLQKKTGPIEAVVQLRGPEAGQEFAAPEETESLARSVIRAVEKATGLKVADSHVFRNLSSFVVSGPAELIRGFGNIDAVRAVVANRQPATAKIPPRNVKPVKRPLPKADTRGAARRSRARS
jgi:hypothetical protein